MSDMLDLNEKVIALFDTEEATQSAVTALRAEGRQVEVLEGSEGRERLAAAGQEGLLSGLAKAAVGVLGDEDRVLGKVDEELARDRTFVVVDTADADEAEVAESLREHGGHFLWHFGKWSYVPLAGASDEL